MLTVAMLWGGEDLDNAFSYFEKKYGKKPNEIEVNPKSSLLGKPYKISVLSCSYVLSKTILIGCREDKEEIKINLEKING